MTSHAAVVARGMGKCCVAGCGTIQVDYKKETMTVEGKILKKGDWLTLDGGTGDVYNGQVKTVEASLSGNFDRIMKLSDKYRRLKIRTNADTPHDSDVARKFGAEGIGLCRTEHMFFNPDRIDHVREMIIADNLEDRKKALTKLLPFQREDFEGIFKAMDGLPCTIRFLDPPLHEFLPHTEEEMKELSSRIHMDFNKIKNRVHDLYEFNPMLGHRGCRLAVTFPEIYAMQSRAVAEAAANMKKKGIKVLPEIMIPIVAVKKELNMMFDIVEKEVKDVIKEKGVEFEYMIGTMIELPRAALVADELAERAEFFSFGTNDLTQTALGLSRDDAGHFLGAYVSAGIYEKDPFVSIDQRGVGQLVQMGVERGRKTRAKLKVGVCGEHGGDPKSIEFFNKVGLDYVSCSPYRVPVARLAAAQAQLKQ
jgi:pyruvate,orthophosphate dikinase